MPFKSKINSPSSLKKSNSNTSQLGNSTEHPLAVESVVEVVVGIVEVESGVLRIRTDFEKKKKKERNVRISLVWF